MVDPTLYQLDAYDYILPEHLIAKHPVETRDTSRLLDCTGEGGEFQHLQFSQLLEAVNPGDCIVLNDTQVLKARLYGEKPSGGKVEVFVIRHEGQYGTAFIKASKSPKPGSTLIIFQHDLTHVDGMHAQHTLQVVEQNPDGTFCIEYGGDWLALFDSAGHLPLPPYMDREARVEDDERYQTVWAAKPGAVAAPTASLHFTDVLLTKLRQKGVRIAYLTLHVGAGTFAPVRADDIREHKMHSEYYEVSDELLSMLRETKASGGRILAIGTTALRALETVGQQGPIDMLQASAGETSIFIYPGFKFTLVDLLITNYHLPKSTLLMLVSAFAGKKRIESAYQEAISNEYRFFSYGDAMLLSRTHTEDDLCR